MLHARHSYVGDLEGAKIKAIGREFIKRTRAASANGKREKEEKANNRRVHLVNKINRRLCQIIHLRLSVCTQFFRFVVLIEERSWLYLRWLHLQVEIQQTKLYDYCESYLLEISWQQFEFFRNIGRLCRNLPMFSMLNYELQTLPKNISGIFQQII